MTPSRKRRWASWWPTGAAATLLAVAGAWYVRGEPPPSAPAERPSASTPEEGRKQAIHAAAAYLVGPVDRVDRELEKLRYKPPVAADVWRQYPAVRKITTMYIA